MAQVDGGRGMTPRAARTERWIAEAARLHRFVESIEQMCYSERDAGLDSNHAIMRDGPGLESSPPGRGRFASRRLEP